ncbi:GNAT family N-acetyltransferase [Gymnodinialimonas sp. 57CJ19]|uniref:GNAT family N-acetyltransferase n=1 Tax=Gymnodinialimonas sp. 57CJ19 TaxID=3138498 RepID=UPI0031343F74
MTARRITAEDLAFVQSLMAAPQMHSHKPDPTLPTQAAIAAAHGETFSHWERHGLGRYVVMAGDTKVGLCGLSVRRGFPGLNLSYHLRPQDWGKGWASLLTNGLVTLADASLKVPYLHGLARPANPASSRVLQKTGFRNAGEVQLGGAPSQLWVRALGKADPIVFYGGAWQPLVVETASGLVLEVPVDMGHSDRRYCLRIAPGDLAALHAMPDRAAIAFATLHALGQTAPASSVPRGTPSMNLALTKVLHAPGNALSPWLTAQDRSHNGAISNLLRLNTQADMAALRAGQWLPLPIARDA